MQLTSDGAFSNRQIDDRVLDSIHTSEYDERVPIGAINQRTVQFCVSTPLRHAHPISPNALNTAFTFAAPANRLSVLPSARHVESFEQSKTYQEPIDEAISLFGAIGLAARARTANVPIRLSRVRVARTWATLAHRPGARQRATTLNSPAGS